MHNDFSFLLPIPHLDNVCHLLLLPVGEVLQLKVVPILQRHGWAGRVSPAPFWISGSSSLMRFLDAGAQETVQPPSSLFSSRPTPSLLLNLCKVKNRCCCMSVCMYAPCSFCSVQVSIQMISLYYVR